jgi:hypothetical protein
MWLLLAAAIGGLASAALVAVFANRGDHPMAQMARCSMGFLVAIVWIMAIADEVVNVLQVHSTAVVVVFLTQSFIFLDFRPYLWPV